MSRRKQSRPQSFKQFLEERKSPNKSEDDNDSTSSTGAQDEDDHHDNQIESTIPEEFTNGDDGIVAATHITANKVFGPFQGTVIKVDPESEEDNKDKPECQQIPDSNGALYKLSINDGKSGCDQQWLTQIAYTMEAANIGIHSQDGKLYLRTLEDISQGCLLKAIYVKEEIQRGVKRPRSNGTYREHEEETGEINHKKIYMEAVMKSPKSPKTIEDNATENQVTSSETAVTSSITDAATSSGPVVIKTEPTDSDTNITNGKEGMEETSVSVISRTEAETESVAMITHENMDKGPPYNCQHCCIEFRNPDNLDAHRTYYCPTTATQPLPASMRRVPPGANTVIKRRNRTPKVPKPTPVPYQVRSGTPPSTSSHGNPEEKTPGTYLCQLCQSSFTNHTNCESHMLLLHCDETVNLCKFCNFIAPSLAKLKVHVFTHVKYFVSSARHSPEPSGVSRGSPPEGYVHQASVLAYRVAEHAAANKIKNPEGTEGSVEDKNNQNPPSPGQTAAADSTEPTKIEEDKGSSSRNTSPVVDDEGRGSAGDSEMKSESEGQYACGHCNFETREKQIFKAHMNQHQLSVLKIQSTRRTPSTFSNVRVLSPKMEHVEAAANKCHECNIVFMSRQNFVAHKQFYCAGRHSQTSPDLPSQAPVMTTRPSEVESHLQVNSQAAGSPKSGRSSNGSQNLTSGIKADDINPPHSNSSSSNPSTPSPLPTMVQLRGPRPPVSSQSSSPSLSSPPPPPAPYIIPTGSVLSGVTQQGAPVLLVAVPFPAAAGGGRSEDLVPSLSSASEEEKPLDLSVKASRSSPEGSPSTSRMGGTPPLRSAEEGSHPAAVIDLSSVTQSTLRSPPPGGQPSMEQLNECKKCDIVFNKYESLLAHKQYYCASRHLRGRQIEMSYQQNVVCSTSPRSGPLVDYVEEGDNKTESYSEQPNSSNQCENINRSSPTGNIDSDEKLVSTKIDAASVVIKQEQEHPSSPNASTMNQESSAENSEDDNVTTCEKTDSNMKDSKSEFEPKDKDSNLLGLKFKLATKHDQSSVSPGDALDKDPPVSREQSTSKEPASMKDAVPPQRQTARNQSPAVELAKQIPRPFSCPACTVSFMKFESLDVHQKFYCAARNIDESPPHPMVNIPKVVPLPVIPEKDDKVSDGSTTPTEPTPHRDNLFCKGCGQYFATSKQVRRHSCKNGVSHLSAGQGTIEQNRAQKRSSPELNVMNDDKRTREVETTGPPIKRYKHETIVENCQDVSKEQANGVVIKQEIVDSSYCSMSSASKCERRYNDKETGEETTEQQVLTRIKHEDESEMSASCHNGSTVSSNENIEGLTSYDASEKDPHSSQRTVITKPAVIKTEQDSNAQDCLNNSDRSSSPKSTLSEVSTNCTDSVKNAIITTVAGDSRVKASGHCRVTSGANLSGRSRVIQQPPAKHCSTCNMDFNSLSNFIAHKKYYCSARQQAKT